VVTHQRRTGPPAAAHFTSRAPALLCDATWYGTLAAARDLGSRGVPITLACDEGLAPARWSRYVTSTVRCPGTRKHDRFLSWLHDFGDRNPGHVLYPTSDDAAWLISKDRQALAAKYRLYAPPLEALATLLDKARLTEAARAAGLDVAETWLPENASDVERIARDARFPLFVKPRTQLLGTEGFKGGRVDRREDLVRIWSASLMPAERELQLGTSMQGVGRPLLMECYPTSETVFTVDGFVAESGQMVALGCNKLLQRPRRLGAGIIFEHASIPSRVVLGLERMLREAGYFGVFDVEFVTDGDRVMLIDINPRFYNHMAFEIDRGLPLPWLSYLGALGDGEALESALQAARADVQEAAGARRRAYVHRLPTRLMLALQGLFGNMSDAERLRWRAWLGEHSGHITDPTTTAADRLPGVADVAFHLLNFLRHPRAFVRDLGCVRPVSGGAHVRR